MGDAVLHFIVSDEVFNNHNNKKEGFLSKQRAKIVSRKHLNKIGQEKKLQKHIESNLNTLPDKIFGNTLEAIIGAIYIDKGMDRAREFIIKNIINSSYINEKELIDYKSKLNNQAVTQKKTLEYRLLKINGPDHKKEFTIAVFINNLKVAAAKAFSIKEAEQLAARKTLNIVS